ncbi:MAG: hypothetical protein GX418_12185 [Clostridiales bacterium]|nr:hypothetical protein [Clostridiales bacterium]
MNYMAFAGVNNLQTGAIITTMPNFPVPAERGEAVEIAGRDGTVWKSEGSYDDISLVPTLYIPPEKIQVVRAWLTGEGELEFEQDAASYYKARISGGVEYTPLDFNAGYQASIPFECQPFRYVRSAPTVSITASGTVVINPHTVFSEPLIHIYGAGNGTMTIGGVTFTITNIVNGMLIDCEAKEAYSGAVALNDRMAGGFPVLAAGENTIIFSGGIGQVDIETRWRML